jgi:hypothetical protein
MPIELGWQEIVLRLMVTVIAGALIGVDRGQHGRPVGLRTTLLVCLASAVSMIQANLLLSAGGRTADSGERSVPTRSVGTRLFVVTRRSVSKPGRYACPDPQVALCSFSPVMSAQSS